MNIVVLLPRVPYPTIKGDKLRMFHFIRELSKYHDVHLFAIDEEKTHQEDIDYLKQYCKTIEIAPVPKITVYANVIKAFFKGLPLQVGYYYSDNVKKQFEAFIDKIKPDHIFCQLVRVAEYVRYIKDIKKTIDIQDTMSVNVARNSKSSGFLKSIMFKIESKRLKKYEYEIFDDFDNKIIISIPDRDLYPHPDREKIHVITNGVDYDFFKPNIDINKEIDVVFTGNMGYIPNIDSSMFLIKDIYPIVQDRIPDVKFMIAGATPPNKLKALETDNIIITGWVEDIRRCYAQAKIFIAPMRIGTGLQNKLLEAMAMKIPCITSSLANESLGAKHNKSILIGDTDEQLAEHILKLMTDKEFADNIAINGHTFVKQNYNWEVSVKQLNNIINQ